MVDYKIKQNDRLPRWRMTLRDAVGAVNLQTATSMKLFMRSTSPGVTANKINGATLTAVDAANGVIEYPWAEGDTDTPGFYHAEVQVEFGTNVRETFPNTGYFVVEVVGHLGD